MSQILHNYFEKYEDAVGTRDKFFSLSDLKSLGTIDDAKRHLIDSKVENILRSSFEDWISFLKEKVNLSMGYIDPYKDTLSEVFQRRNIVVHNGGIINTIYSSKVSKDLLKGKRLGEEMNISRAYLDKSIGLFELVFILIAAELWKSQSPKDETRANLLIGIAFDHLTKERWGIAEGLSFFVMNDKNIPEKEQLFGKLNYWQSMKWQGKYEKVRSEIENTDFSAKDSLFQLALFAISEKQAEFFRLLPEMVVDEIPEGLSCKKISYESIATWPIFREIRKTEDYAKFYGDHKAHFDAIDGKDEDVKADALKSEELAS